MKAIYIEIAGEAGVGKSTIAHRLGNILKLHGMDVTILDDQFDDSKLTLEQIDTNLASIGADGKVIIRCKQLTRRCL